MLRRGLAFCLLLGMASVARGGAAVTLVPTVSGPYAPSQEVQVDVFLTQDAGGADRLLRFVQFDFNGSEAGPTIFLPRTHDLATDIYFWNFLGVPNCPTDITTTCGAGHYIEDRITTGPRPKVLSTAYYFTDPGSLGPNTNAQRKLLADRTPLWVGRFTARMPTVDGCYTLDVLNPAQTNPDLGGGDVRFGFGTDVDGNAITVWRANTGQLTGGTKDMQVGTSAPCGPPVCTVDLVSAAPACDASLPRTQNNLIRLTFDAAITDPAGAIQIRALTAGGGFDPTNLAGGFTITVESPTVLKIRENGTQLANRTWYGVTSTGWGNVCGFEVDYVTVRGDASGNKSTDVLDANSVLANRGAAPDNSRFDMNGNGSVDVLDANTALGNRGSAAPAKPTGHVCP